MTIIYLYLFIKDKGKYDSSVCLNRVYQSHYLTEQSKPNTDIVQSDRKEESVSYAQSTH